MESKHLLSISWLRKVSLNMFWWLYILVHFLREWLHLVQQNNLNFGACTACCALLMSSSSHCVTADCQKSIVLCISMAGEHSHANTSEVPRIDQTCLCGPAGMWRAVWFWQLLSALRAVCAMPKCSVFWHHGVPCVGVLADRAPRGSSCSTVDEVGGC